MYLLYVCICVLPASVISSNGCHGQWPQCNVLPTHKCLNGPSFTVRSKSTVAYSLATGCHWCLLFPIWQHTPKCMSDSTPTIVIHNGLTGKQIVQVTGSLIQNKTEIIHSDCLLDEEDGVMGVRFQHLHVWDEHTVKETANESSLNPPQAKGQMAPFLAGRRCVHMWISHTRREGTLDSAIRRCRTGHF